MTDFGNDRRAYPSDVA